MYTELSSETSEKGVGQGLEDSEGVRLGQCLYLRARTATEGFVYFFMLSVILGSSYYNPPFTGQESRALGSESGHLPECQHDSQTHILCTHQPPHRVGAWFERWKVGPSVAVWRWWALYKVGPSGRCLGHGVPHPWTGSVWLSRGTC